jgi:hypothetical protein
METTSTHMPVITVRCSREFLLQYITRGIKYEEYEGRLIRRLETVAAILYWPSTNSPPQVTSYHCYLLPPLKAQDKVSKGLIFEPPAVATY